MKSLRVFANPQCVSHGWYWAMPSHDLKRLEKRELKLFGATMVFFRTASGKVRAVDAYCPHMGAHLIDGRVEGETIRCGFHGWRFSENGERVEKPCGPKGSANAPVRLTWYRVAERFGMIWVHTDSASTDPLPDFAELEGEPVSVFVDRPEIRHCHPTLILGGGVDEEHFLFVHGQTTAVSGPLSFSFERVSPQVIKFWNTADIAGGSFKSRLLRWVYGGVLKYEVTYWSASTALAKLGPPFLPLFAIFAYRPTVDGKTEGLNIYVTKKRRGLGMVISLISIVFTRAILRKGGQEDAVIQNRIRFRVGPETFENPPFAAFVKYVEDQPTLPLGDSQ